MRDPWDNIAEFAFANLWIVKNGVALTPADNKTFLAGITRMRTMALLNEAGIEAREATLSAGDLAEAGMGQASMVAGDLLRQLGPALQQLVSPERPSAA